MDGIGKIDNIGADRKRDYISFGCEHENIVVKKIDFQRPEEFVRVLDIFVSLDNFGDPLQLLVNILFAFCCSGLVFPVSGNTVFRNLMHLLSPDLHLKGNAVPTDDRGMQRPVHIGLGGGNIILEPTGNRLEHIMDNA